MPRRIPTGWNGAARELGKSPGGNTGRSGAAAPAPPPSGLPIPLLPAVRSEQIDPADKEGISWLCGLLANGRADLYGQDEADLARIVSSAVSELAAGRAR